MAAEPVVAPPEAFQQQQLQQTPLFSKFGLTIYRKDIKDARTGALAHPWATVALVAITISIAVLVLVFAGGIKPNSFVYIILGIPVTGFGFLVLALLLEMKVKTLLVPILCVVLLMGGGSGWSYYWTLVTQKYTLQPATVQEKQLPNVHNEYETIAQSVCTSMAIKQGWAGWTFAVRRQCDSTTKHSDCGAICGTKDLYDEDAQLKNKRLACLGAIHVYHGRQPSTTKPSIGFKVFWSSGYHESKGCGPNYCCCAAAA